jgi:prenyltransferase beta subunit
MRRAVLVLWWTALWVDPLCAQTAEEKQQTVAALQDLQRQDGGFRPNFPGARSENSTKSSLRATTSALRALKYFGGQVKHQQASADFVKSCFDKATGGFAEKPGGDPDATTTAIGLMAVVEVNLPVKDYSEAASTYLAKHARTFEEIRLAAAAMEAIQERSSQTEAWLAQIAQMRNEDGTYGKGDGIARATGGAVAAVLRLGGTVEQRDNVLRALQAGQRSDGGFGQEGKRGSDLETSYRVTRAFHMLKEKPNSERLRAFIGKCRNADGGYGVTPGQPSQVGATYFAAMILHWLEE